MGWGAVVSKIVDSIFHAQGNCCTAAARQDDCYTVSSSLHSAFVQKPIPTRNRNAWLSGKRKVFGSSVLLFAFMLMVQSLRILKGVPTRIPEPVFSSSDKQRISASLEPTLESLRAGDLPILPRSKCNAGARSTDWCCKMLSAGDKTTLW